MLQAKHHEMVEESVLPPVFLKHPECLHPLQAKNPVTCAVKDLSKELVKELVRNSGISHSLTPRGRPRRSAEGLTRLQVGGHFPEKILGTGKKSNITRACVVCFPAQKKILKRTGDKRKRPGKESSFQCSVCKVALCMQDCFQLYHTVEDYVAAYIRGHEANIGNVDAETN